MLTIQRFSNYFTFNISLVSILIRPRAENSTQSIGPVLIGVGGIISSEGIKVMKGPCILHFVFDGKDWVLVCHWCVCFGLLVS